MKKKTKPTEKVITALESGQRVTSKRMKRLGVACPSGAVWYFRHRMNMPVLHDGRAYYMK